MNDNNSLQTNDFHKNLNKHNNCSKCCVVLTQDNYKKGRTVCRMCYNNNVLRYYKNKFGSDLASKTDAGTQTDFPDVWNSLINQDISTNKSTSNICDNSNKKRNTHIKKDRSTKKDNLIIQDSSNIEDITIDNIFDNDPNHLCDKLKEILSKPNMIENDYTMTKMILDELLRTKCIPKRQYNAMCKKIGLK